MYDLLNNQGWVSVGIDQEPEARRLRPTLTEACSVATRRPPRTGILPTVVRALAWSVFVGLLAGLSLTIYVWRAWDRTWDVPFPDLHASTEPAIVARGEYLVLGPAHCAACHMSSTLEYARSVQSGARPAMAGGRPFNRPPLGTLYSKNLTPDRETGIGRYTDAQIARMLRHGVRPDGRASIPLLMPYWEMSDEDVVAVISYLRAQPPVRREVPESRWTPLGKVIRSFMAVAQPYTKGHPPRVAPHAEPTIARGRYLALSVADCSLCHTSINPLTGEPGQPFTGGDALEPIPVEGVDMSRWFNPPNITPLIGSALRRFPDRAAFVARFKIGGRKYDGSPMPWEAMSQLSAEDVGAIYDFLRSIPPGGEPAPDDPRSPLNSSTSSGRPARTGP